MSSSLEIMLLITGFLFAVAIWGFIDPKGAKEARTARTLRKEARGVHWIWWLVAILLVPVIVGIPLLIVIAIVHIGRKNRATMRELAKE